MEKERTEFKQLLTPNPNYFGTSPEVKIKPSCPGSITLGEVISIVPE